MNINKIKEDFNILNKKINGKPYVYLDSACMSLKPILVVNKIIESEFLSKNKNFKVIFA